MKNKTENQLLNRVVKFKNPLHGEENQTYKITNYNEVTERCYITPVASKYPFLSTELVNLSELEIIN